MSRKLLILLDDPELPSSYVSALQFVELLRGSGFEVETAAVRSPDLGRRKKVVEHYARRLHVEGLSRPLLRRLEAQHEEEIVRRASSADIVYVVKATAVGLLQRLRELSRPRILLHVSDAFWLPFLRRHGWADLDPVLSMVDGITTTNEYTASHLRAAQPRVFVVPDCPQVEDFDRYRDSAPVARGEVVVGWIGTPLTAMALFRVWEPLERLAAARPNWTLRLIGIGSPDRLMNVPRFEKVRWSHREWYGTDEMIREVLSMDVGIFPLFQSEDALARGALKTLVYMAGGVASVSQALGDNLDLVQDGQNGFLADSDQAWFEKLQLLIDEPRTRAVVGDNGLKTVRAQFSRREIFTHLRSALEAV